MTTLKTYRIVEFDANDVPRVLRTGLSRAEAREVLARLRSTYGTFTCLRYIMKRDTAEAKRDDRVGDYLWTGQW